MKQLLHVTCKQFSIHTQTICLQKHGHYKKAQNHRGGRTGLEKQELQIPSFKFFVDDRCEHRKKLRRMGGPGGWAGIGRREGGMPRPGHLGIPKINIATV